MIKFYYHPGPNPMKVALFFEETGLPYELIPVDTLKGEQHLPEFRAINPNGKTPAIDDDGARVFDSNAILLYLSEKSGQLRGTAETRSELLSWMMFLASGLGPYSGQCVHFRHAAPEQIPYAVNRYRREAQRHYGVLNAHLAERTYIVGEEYSIADIAAWGWIDKANVVLGEGELAEFPHLENWYDRISQRPAVARARVIGQDVPFQSEMDDRAKRALYPQNFPENDTATGTH